VSGLAFVLLAVQLLVPLGVPAGAAATGARGAKAKPPAADLAAPQAPDAGPADAGPADAGTQLPEAAPLSVNAAIAPDKVTLGDTFNYVITLRHDPADAYALPADLVAPFAKGGIEPRGEPQVQRTAAPSEARTVFTLPLAVTGSLKPQLPELTLHVQGPAGPRIYKVAGPPIAVESLVDSEGQGMMDRAHHGPKPPEPVWMRSWLWLGLLAALAAVVAAIVLLRKLRKKQREEAARPPPPPKPHEVAFHRLKALRLRAPWRTGAGRAAIFELSEIVRVYLGERFGFNAIDLTSDELVAGLKAREAGGAQGLEAAAFARQVAWEDLVKFARVEPTEAECLAAIEFASQLVERTQERLVRERHAELAAGEPAAQAPSAAKPAHAPAHGDPAAVHASPAAAEGSAKPAGQPETKRGGGQ
jgi:hypothetical protein